MTRGPVLIDLDGTEAAQPDTAPAVPDVPQGAAMQHVAAIATRRPSRLARWFWSVTIALTGFVVSLAAWDYINTLLARSPILGG
ncbi:MAG TPA: TIGR01620 family protein, partial [Yoonia sp.]|nr:TIGR01620 family protein [Yoonia sp.]